MMNLAKKKERHEVRGRPHGRVARRTYALNSSQPEGPRRNLPSDVVASLANIDDIAFGPRLADRTLRQWRIVQNLGSNV